MHDSQKMQRRRNKGWATLTGKHLWHLHMPLIALKRYCYKDSMMSFASIVRHLITGLGAVFVIYQNAGVAFADQRAGTLITPESTTCAWGEKEHETNPVSDPTNDKDNPKNGWCNAEHMTAGGGNPCDNTQNNEEAWDVE